ncbi:MAG: mechanosensitive ion channel protein MscS [Candidatus Firestonebacteria bacterium RIFOXYC2_FULL_39_67]|nr:MAG: mechanosensitive ion channel protein MscS [Candidatus Firestonebacteria bacterium RIFOXYD2_FULL_39_29]OGF55398.1 MAG: mechanosensitive ion channel protein MscS [Candidatus Firestonebacteria bacterium RIFOXYC2_FULL_39_67]
MTLDEQTIKTGLKAMGIILGSLGAGFTVEKVILARLKKLAEKTTWEGDDIIIEALNTWVTMLILLPGIYFAALYLPLSEKIEGNINKILMALAIFFTTIILSKIAVGFIGLYTKKAEGNMPSTSIFANITKVVMFSLGGLVILQSLGISVTPILTALGVGGLAVALALQDTLSNLFSGIQVLASRQIKPGDYIKLNSGEEGYVSDITWRNTTLKTLPNNYIVLPNSKLATSIVTNFHAPTKEMAVGITITVSYGSDIPKAEKAIVEIGTDVMNTVTGGVPGHKPAARVAELADFGIKLGVGLMVKEFADQFLIKHEFLKRLLVRFKEDGIETPFPTSTVYLKKE